MSLVNQLGGAFHATACRNLLSIMGRGILPAANMEDDYNRRYESGRVHSHYGLYAPWDPRKVTTKSGVSGYHDKAHAIGGILYSHSGPHPPRRKNDGQRHNFGE